MALKTRRVEAGDYRYDHPKLGSFIIRKNTGYYPAFWTVQVFDSYQLLGGRYRTKKAALRFLASHIEKVTGSKPERRAPSNKTFEASHRTSRAIREQLPYPSNGCVPIAFARALTRHDDPTDEEIGIMAAMVSEDLDCVDRKGTHRGDLSRSARKVGIEHTKVKAETNNNWHRKARYTKYRVARFPTVAQFLRANPNIKTAILRTTGHAGYYEDGVAYGLGARARIDHALVLEWKE